MPFYRKQDGQLVASDFVDGPGYMLSEAGKADHTYPVDGWHWFADLDTAIAGITSAETGSVTMRQASLALLNAGLLDDVEALVATLPRAYQIEWERASTVQRDNQLVEIVRQQQGMTHAQIDDLFAQAATL